MKNAGANRQKCWTATGALRGRKGIVNICTFPDWMSKWIKDFIYVDKEIEKQSFRNLRTLKVDFVDREAQIVTDPLGVIKSFLNQPQRNHI